MRNLSKETQMAILITAGKAYYQISDAVLKKCKITKKQYEKARKEATAEVAGQSCDDYVIDLRGCCMSKKSYLASCL